jgi:hypothetical protein
MLQFLHGVNTPQYCGLFVQSKNCGGRETAIARQRLGKYIPAEVNARNNGRAALSVTRAARVSAQRCCNHVSAAVNQHATIEEAVFSVDPPQGYNNEYLTQLELELSRDMDLAVTAEN